MYLSNCILQESIDPLHRIVHVIIRPDEAVAMRSRAEVKELLSLHSDSASIVIVDPNLAILDAESQAEVCGILAFRVAGSIDEIENHLKRLKGNRNLVITLIDGIEELKKFLGALALNNSNVYVILIDERGDDSVTLANLLPQ